MILYLAYLHTFVHNHLDKIDMIKKQYIDLLSNLTECPMISNELFLEQINKIHEQGEIVILYVDDFLIVGTGTILIENKIIHGGKPVGHIEDIVVHPEYRNNNISQAIINKLKEYGDKCYKCYKIILNCQENVKKVYIKAGFVEHGIQMRYN